MTSKSLWSAVAGRLSRRWIQIIAPITILAIVGLIAGGLFYTHQRAYAAAPGTGCDVNATQNTPTCTYNGLTASANFVSWSADQCVMTYVNVIASQGFTNNPSLSLNSGNGVDFMAVTYDNCQQVETSLLSGQANNVNFTIDNQLNTATLNATVMATDWDSPNQDTYPVTINMTWQGVGPSGQTISSTHNITGIYVFNTRYNGTTRMAEVSGGVTSSAVSVSDTAPNMDGMLTDASGGQIYVTHG